MKNKRFIAALLSAAVSASFFSGSAVAADNAEEANTLHKVTFLDLEGNTFKVIDVADGEIIDYSSINTDSMHRHIDAYTEEKFSKWSIMPETVDKDVTIEALYSRVKLSFDSLPDRIKYLTKEGSISTEGMKVSVTTTTQLADKDETGNYILEGTKVDITPSCKITPSKLQDVFKDGKMSGKVTVYASGESLPVASFDVFYLDLPGDVNRSGRMEADDASLVLKEYTELSSNANALSDGVAIDSNGKMLSGEEFIAYADVNCDRKLTADDASMLLRFYTLVSSDADTKWSDIADIK